MSLPHNVHFVWFGEWPKEPYATWRQELMSMNPDYSFWLWNEDTIGQLGLNLDSLRNRFPTWAGVSNAVRLHAVHQKGGVYLDADFISHKPMAPLFEDYGDAWVAEQEAGRRCNAIFAATKGHAWIGWQIEHMHKYEKIAAFWGVDLMTEAPSHGVTVIPQRLVYPYLFDAPEEQRIPHADTILQHRWAGSWLPNNHK